MVPGQMGGRHAPDAVRVAAALGCWSSDRLRGNTGFLNADGEGRWRFTGEPPPPARGLGPMVEHRGEPQPCCAEPCRNAHLYLRQRRPLQGGALHQHLHGVARLHVPHQAIGREVAIVQHPLGVQRCLQRQQQQPSQVRHAGAVSAAGVTGGHGALHVAMLGRNAFSPQQWQLGDGRCTLGPSGRDCREHEARPVLCGCSTAMVCKGLRSCAMWSARGGGVPAPRRPRSSPPRRLAAAPCSPPTPACSCSTASPAASAAHAHTRDCERPRAGVWCAHAHDECKRSHAGACASCACACACGEVQLPRAGAWVGWW
jgi:hypothetical protein